MENSIWREIHPKEPVRNLNWLDLIALTSIMFGYFIFTSTRTLLSNLSQTAAIVDTEVIFTDEQNWSGIRFQGCLLLIAFAYLLLRNFDFKQFKDKIRLEWSLLFWILIVHVLSSLAADIQYYNIGLGNAEWTLDSFWPYISNLTPGLFLYSLLNGFYEEFFFLGLLLSTDKRQRIPVLIFSTIVRMSFHTYVGIPFALMIGILFGGIYNYLYLKKYNNLLAYFLAHALCDMYGIGVLYLFMPR